MSSPATVRAHTMIGVVGGFSTEIRVGNPATAPIMED
jgi:hypothetical protein